MGTIVGPLIILVLVLLALSLIRTLSAQSAAADLKAARIPAPLPERSAEQLKEMFDGAASEWVDYPGSTPPLRLRVRGLSYELYRRVARRRMGPLSGNDPAAAAMLPTLNNVVMAEGYVTDWHGATYPNGAEMPYSPENLAAKMAQDQYLAIFVIQQGQRLSPPWPDEAEIDSRPSGYYGSAS